ncbi:OsmC family protein [Kineococcus sp. SYSU DK006]|uniref:OsmC family protein n=1 Tax=Kineococcus sp. SYSU DK006 TaxID=3383127 RepID=UPI003D7E98EE
MTGIEARVRSLPGTAAAVGTSGRHSVVVDRPDGVAGGAGLGFNGGQLLALAVGGCLANDLRCAAHARGVELEALEVRVEVDVEDGRVTGADVDVRVSAGDGVDTGALVRAALEASTVLAAVRTGFAVRLPGAG